MNQEPTKKGYWLFDRNAKIPEPNEGYLNYRTGQIEIWTKAQANWKFPIPPWLWKRLVPLAIYKWISTEEN